MENYFCTKFSIETNGSIFCITFNIKITKIISFNKYNANKLPKISNSKTDYLNV